MTGEEVIRSRAPLVYVWRRGDDILYIGSALRGIRRPLESGHHRLRHILSDDTLQFLRCDTAEEALTLEKRLIRDYHPKLNGRGSGVSGEAIEGRTPHTSFRLKPDVLKMLGHVAYAMGLTKTATLEFLVRNHKPLNTQK
jgi:hypothetical protein